MTPHHIISQQLSPAPPHRPCSDPGPGGCTDLSQGPPMIIHPALHMAHIPTSDRALLSVSRLGPATSPAAIVYLHSPFTCPNYWTPLIAHLHSRLDGRIRQLTYRRRTADRLLTASPGCPAVSATGADDLAAVLDLASGAVVVVAHSAACRPVLSWIEKYPHRTRALSGIVLLNPALELPDIPVDPERWVQDELLDYFYRTPGESGWSWRGGTNSLADRAQISIGASVAATFGTPVLTETTLEAWRCIPTWVLAGALDPLAPPQRCRALSERVWADFDCALGAGHALPYTDPQRASQPILAALEVAYRTHLHDGGRPW